MMESRKGGHNYEWKPLDYGTLTKEQFDAEIEKGIADIKAGRVYSADEVEKEMKELMK